MTSKNRNFLDSATVISIVSMVVLSLELLQEHVENPNQGSSE